MNSKIIHTLLQYQVCLQFCCNIFEKTCCDIIFFYYNKLFLLKGEMVLNFSS